MGRPRSKNRMSRMVQARVTDEQYNYLVYRATEFHSGDLSQAIRESIGFAEELMQVVESEDPPGALATALARWRQEFEETRDAVYMDEPDDENEGRARYRCLSRLAPARARCDAQVARFLLADPLEARGGLSGNRARTDHD
jgi:hypothetical protein